MPSSARESISLTAFSTGTSAYLLDRLQSVLNSAARLILRIGKYDPISAAIRRDLHWLPVPFRIRYKLNSITSNCLAGRAPEYLIELCHSVTDIPARRNLRSSSRVQLLVPRYRKERSGKRGFSVSSPQLWNLLPADIRLLHNDHQLFPEETKDSLHATVHVMPLRIDVNSVNSTTTTTIIPSHQTTRPDHLARPPDRYDRSVSINRQANSPVEVCIQTHQLRYVYKLTS